MDDPNLNRAAPVKALHTWSLFRTLGSYVAPGSMLGAGPDSGTGEGLDLLDLPAELAARGYRSIQLCHFYLPQRDAAYLQQLRAALDAADVELECLLIDAGDVAQDDPAAAAEHEAWIDGWLTTAEQLGAPRARVCAGMVEPTPERITRSAAALVRLAERHPELRVITENWRELLPDADAVLSLLSQTGDRVGFLIDLGNWTGPGKYAELERVAHLAETCQAKASTDAADALDLEDYRRSLQILRDIDYTGPLAMVYDGPSPDEWDFLEQERQVVEQVFA